MQVISQIIYFTLEGNTLFLSFKVKANVRDRKIRGTKKWQHFKNVHPNQNEQIKTTTCNACFEAVQEPDMGAPNFPAVLEVTTTCPFPFCRKYLTTLRDRAMSENTFNSKSSRSTSRSIISHRPRCERPALHTRMSS